MIYKQNQRYTFFLILETSNLEHKCNSGRSYQQFVDMFLFYLTEMFSTFETCELQI